MRYYIYLDKCFIRNIYSVIDGFEFSIDVLELTEECGCRTNSNINIDPGFENVRDYSVNNKQDNCYDNGYQKKINRKKANVCYGYSKYNDSRKIKKYINIQDITAIKCTKFYHNLLKKLENKTIDDKKIIIEKGFFVSNYSENITNNKVLKLNNTYILLNKENIDIDMQVLNYASCEVTVIGYLLNDKFNNEYKLLKAVAIYIE